VTRLEQTDAAEVEAIRAIRAQGHGVVRTARQLRVGVGTVLRLTGGQQ
jgi:hypothetical protein